ncbi:MAG: type II toxin-antitoxin system Phd/YefM family antitoxin [Actinomycetia bacterium]|nr:type II toxin-antitoxin system Phd/YefM family antitoxin [Actinomycetes bacterium]
MTTVDVLEVKTRLPHLLTEVASGEEFIVARADRPVARLVGLDDAARARRHLGGLRGQGVIANESWTVQDVEALFSVRHTVDVGHDEVPPPPPGSSPNPYLGR